MLRLALIGGSHVCEQYGRIAARIRNARFSAVAKRDAGIAERTARLLGAEIWTDGFDKLMSSHAAAFDAVLIHSTNPSHELHCRSAAQAGRHILVESPLAMSSRAAQSVVDECGRSGVRLMVGQIARFWPSVQAVKESLDGGKLGQPGLLRIHLWESLPSVSSNTIWFPPPVLITHWLWFAPFTGLPISGFGTVLAMIGRSGSPSTCVRITSAPLCSGK